MPPSVELGGRAQHSSLFACKKGSVVLLCRDIKPENVLFGTNMVLKIADLGLAVNLREEPAVTRVGKRHSRLTVYMESCHGCGAVGMQYQHQLGISS
jgi:serine/threonine protein kinase